ncbi:uncharacterized protein LOC142563915 isoform X6 [Dermacentor variabilis]|uniref:uncharacterized protein LOC142563915 isoform X6 n=1 Tax=Dermacentor variabilis TaxID=34621 RepID=UPI003F5AE7E4
MFSCPVGPRFVQPGSHGLQSWASTSHLPANAMPTLAFFPASFCIGHSRLFLPCFLASLFGPMFQATLGKMLE